MSARCGYLLTIAAAAPSRARSRGRCPRRCVMMRSPPTCTLRVASVDRLAVLALLDDDAEALERGRTPRGTPSSLAEQQLERGVGRLVVVALVLRVLTRSSTLASLRRRARGGGRTRVRLATIVALARELRDQDARARCPPGSGSMCSKVARAPTTAATCMPPLCAKALRPT